MPFLKSSVDVLRASLIRLKVFIQNSGKHGIIICLFDTIKPLLGWHLPGSDPP